MKLRWAALLCGFTATLAFAPGAGAYVYWANSDVTSIGRADLDGTGANEAFVTTDVHPCGVALDDTYVYWAGGEGEGFVGRAPLSTRVAEDDYIETANDLPCGVAVDSNYVYWDNYILGSIARATLDGSVIDHTFIPGGSNPQMPAVDSAHIYWVNKDGNSVGRADITGLNPNQMFIDNTNNEPVGVAVDNKFVYWANRGAIGRAKLDGTGVPDQDFITTNDFVCGVAVDSDHIYFGEYGSSVGRADIDGQNVDEEFIPTSGGVCGVAVDSGGPTSEPPSNDFKPKPKSECKGACHTFAVKVVFDSDGKVIAEDAKTTKAGRIASDGAAKKKKPLIKRLKKSVKAGSNKLKLKLTKTAKAKLDKKGKLKVKVRFTFTPTGGEANQDVQSFKLKPKA